MLCRRTNALGFSLVLLATASLLPGCARRNEEAKSVEPAPRVASTIEPAARVLALASPTPTPTPASKLSPPPNPTEIRDTVARVFGKVATADTTRNSTFAVGDFNGDGSEDLAIVVNPGEGGLKEINNELANWVLEDPRTVAIPSSAPTARVPPGKPVWATKGDTLLAIIHGVGPLGWRAPEAKQTFVLKNAAGSKFLAQTPGKIRNTVRKSPALRGDVLNETIGGQSGFVFWTGSKYAWWTSSPN